MSDIVEKINTILCESSSKVADEIMNQIRSLDRNALNYWGAKDFVASDDALRFRVHTPSFTGIIRIILDTNDTYKIEKAKITNLQYKIIDKKEDIYAENLVSVIDSMIENK